MKKYFLSLVFIVVGFQSLASINHGSAIGKNLPLYPIRNGGDPTAPVAGVTFDYKVVTIGTKTWVWTNLNGKHIAANNWSSQIRFLYPDKQEYNLLNRVVNTQQTYGIAGLSDVDPCAVAFPDADSYVITFVQQVNTDFYETADIVYNHTQPSPLPETDYTPPVMNFSAIASRTDKQLRLSLSASDDSENFFYYIEDAANGIMEISFSDEAVLNIEPGKYYHFSVCAIDFSGNQSETLLTSHLPDSIRNGSDFYVIYMDAEGEESLGTKVKEKSMLRSYDIWNGTLTTATRTDVNAWGINVSDSWVALDVAAGAKEIGWNGGAIVADLSGFKSRPNLKEITDNPNDYYFHFAIRSPAGKPSAGWTLIFYSDGTPDGLKYYYVGPDTGTDSLHGLSRLGDYTGNGEWQHFEIPVSQLVLRGYKWNGPLTGEKQYLLGFQSPANVPGTELNLDAVFFYKKAESVDISTPVLSNSGTAMAISFKVDSRSLNALQIICTTDATASNPFVTLELDGVEVIGRWEPVTDWRNSQNKYLFVIPATEIRGWATGAIFGLNFGYSRNDGNLVTDNKVITNGENSGKRILHKTGTGDDISNLPDSISNGSDFYNIYMDVVSEASLGEKVKEKNMIRDIEIWGETLTSGKNRSGINAFDVPDNWVALDVVGDAKGVVGNGGAIVANLSEFEKAPNLKDITDNPDKYSFHFAIKSPANQAVAGWTLMLYSEGDTLRYYVGPDTVANALGLLWLGNYTHNGKWQHFEIPVKQMVAIGYKWNKPLAGDKQPLLGFQSPANVSGTELNLDAVFFYKKPNYTAPAYPTIPAVTEGTAKDIYFKLDSRSQEMKIECTSSSSISDLFVKFELNGMKVTGQWKPVISDQSSAVKRYVITLPTTQIHGWKKDAILGLSFGYKLNGKNVIADTITYGINKNSLILHKIGTGVDVFVSNLPDSIRTGSDFYIISMDKISEASLGAAVKIESMFREVNILDNTLTAANRTGNNAYNVSDHWIAYDINAIAASRGKNGGVIVADLSRSPDLSDVTLFETVNDYFFHFAVKSPDTQPDAGWTLTFYNENDAVQYYIGPDAVANVHGIPWLGNYTHNGEWQYFEIPVSQMVALGYKWSAPLTGDSLLGFQSTTNAQGTELNLDALFFYKKPVGTIIPTPEQQPALMSEGTTGTVSFKLDSRAVDELQIVCTAETDISNPFVKLELNGVKYTGKWNLDANSDTSNYKLTLSADQIHGWKKDAILGLSFCYTRDGKEIIDNKVTSGVNIGKPILHKIGSGVDVTIPNLPDSIRKGTDFYIISMDTVQQASLDAHTTVKEKNMCSRIEIQQNTLYAETCSGKNALGVENSWISYQVNSDVISNTGNIVADLSLFEKAPNLKDITDNPDDYCLHFAVKRPSDQLSKGLKLTLYSDNKNLRYYVGPETESALNLLWLGDYTGNGEWQHFEIPVSQMVALGYKWNEPLSGDNGKRILLGFEAMERIRGTEINLDAIFFYKKPNYTAPVYSSSPKYNEGATDRINFKLDSRTQNELRIMCTTTENISNPFVELFICGTKIIGRTTPEYTDFVPATKRYLITIPLEGYGNPDAFLNLNFGYTLDGNEVIENTTADGMPILHKTGEGVNISYLPDDISNGSDFYIITMDPLSEASLGNKVKEKKIMHGYDVENDPESIDVGSDATTVNTFGVHYPWLSFRISGLWAAVTIFTNYSAESGSRPDLSSVTDNPQDYYLHIAAKGKEGGNWGRSLYLDFYSDGGVYSRDDSYITSMGGAWLHIDIPVSDLTNSYKWNGPLNPGKVNLIKFELPVANTGDEINLDAIFFYKKP